MATALFACGCTCDDPDGKRRAKGSEFDDVVAAPVLQQLPYVKPSVARTFFQTFSSAPDQPLLGVPIREGGLWHLSTQDRFEPVNFCLYVNGVSFSTSDGLEASVSLSPFSLVRNCRFQAGECAKLKSFKLSLLDHDPCCYFAIKNLCDREAEEERSDWVLGISHTILLITDSLLPSFSITCDPLQSAPHTHRRLMAGYLVHREDASSISVVFCELEAHKGATARIVLYENDLCELPPLVDILITDVSVCCDIVGINCSCFIVDSHHFASQTPSERKLWLRALSNVKVKIQNRAPEASEEELWHYRSSIREVIRGLEATLVPRISSDPLLARIERKRTSAKTSDDAGSNVTPPAAVADAKAARIKINL